MLLKLSEILLIKINPKIGTTNALKKMHNEIDEIKKNGLQLYNYNENTTEILEKSDIFFVLGSGPSILELSEKQFRILEHNFTLGLNNWFIHPFEPDLLMFEGIADPNEVEFKEWQYDSVRNYLKVSNCKFLLKDIRNSSYKFRSLMKEYPDRCFGVPKCVVPGRSFAAFRANFMSLAKKRGVNLFRRGSVSLAISIAVQMGYKKIVLCGVDMRDGLNFWDATEFKLRKGFCHPPNLSGSKMIHSTMDQTRGDITLDKVIKIFSEIYNDKGIKIFVSSDSSILSSSLPVFNWPEDSYK